MYNPPSPDAVDEELEKLCPWDHGCQEALAKMQQQHQESILNVDWSRSYVNCQGAPAYYSLGLIYDYETAGLFSAYEI